jgi:hypothetical protein
MSTPYTTPGPLAQKYRITRGQRSRAKGWRMPANGVYCGRPSLWGNPYRAPRWYPAETCCERYAAMVARILTLSPNPDNPWRGWRHWGRIPDKQTYFAPLVERWKQHRSLVLLCWCREGAPCHCVPLADAVAAELERQGVTP